MQSPQAKLKDITRLLASWPSATGEGEEQLRSYLLAVDDYTAGDVTAAVDALIKGIAPGVNQSFLPPPAVVGGECRRQMGLRHRSEDLEKRYRPALPSPDIERTPESQSRVRELMERTIGGLKRMTEDDDHVERHRSVLRTTNEYFDAERGFSVGDPEGAADAA